MEEFQFDASGQQRLAEYFDLIGDALGLDERRTSYAIYAMGLFGDGDRKSMEPIAARANPDTRRVNAQHQRIQHFITDSMWSDRAVRREAARYGVSALTARESITHWIGDDTGFLKQGSHSVGVKRQYTGSAGKVTNCQVGVSVSVATPTNHLPIDFELYLPHDWIDDDVRRREARIPDDVVFKTKLELMIDIVDRALADGAPRHVPGRHRVRKLQSVSPPAARTGLSVRRCGQFDDQGVAARQARPSLWWTDPDGFRICQQDRATRWLSQDDDLA